MLIIFLSLSSLGNPAEVSIKKNFFLEETCIDHNILQGGLGPIGDDFRVWYMTSTQHVPAFSFLQSGISNPPKRIEIIS